MLRWLLLSHLLVAPVTMGAAHSFGAWIPMTDSDHWEDIVASDDQDVCPTSGWPPPSKLMKLKSMLDGDLYLPGHEEYWNGTIMKYHNWNRHPGCIVMAETREDVQKALLFAHWFKLPLTIASSGHDFNGRAIADHSFHISLHRMNDIKVADGVDHAWMEPGCEWRKAYEAVDGVNQLVVGGSAPTVAAGGYFLGGGHSPMTPTLGLGVDSVLEIELVTTDGRIVNVTESELQILHPDNSTETVEDSDLFWALRGGGGVFGVVTGYKLQLHDPPPDGFVRMSVVFPMHSSLCGDMVEEVIQFYSEYLLVNQSAAGWGGYFISTNLDMTVNETMWFNGTMAFYFLHRGGWEEAWPSAEPLYNFRPECQGSRTIQNVSTFWDHQKDVDDPVGFRGLVVNRFLQRDHFEQPEGLVRVIKAMLDRSVPMQCTGALLGGKASGPTADDSSVSQDFRDGLMSLSCGTGWADATDDDHHHSEVRKFSVVLYDNVGRGTYYNEPDYNLTNWKTDFWGPTARYQRLVDIKRKWDPDFQIRCHHCVGSDEPEPTMDPPTTIPPVGGATRTYQQVAVLVSTIMAAIHLTI